MFRVNFFFRKPGIGAHSMERLFSDVRGHLPSEIHATVTVSKYPSSGIFKRLYNMFEAWLSQGDVNHVTGDVHFLTYFLNRRKTVLTIHDCVGMERLGGFRRFLFWFFWMWLPEKRCAAITVVSEATRQQVLKYLHCNPDKIKVIYNSVSTEFKPVLGIFNHSCPRILQIGTSPNKNVERVIASLAGLSCKLVIIGHLSDALKRSLNNYKIDFESMENLSRDELLAEYVACDLLIFVSTYEGFGLPIVEANAVGRPVITSTLWSMPEVAVDAACLVDPFNVSEIREGVLRIIEDSNYRDMLVKNGFKNVKRFQIESTANQYADIYRKVYFSARGEQKPIDIL